MQILHKLQLFALLFLSSKAELVLTPVHRYSAPAGSTKIMNGDDGFGWGFLAYGVTALFSLLAAWIVITRLRRRDQTERDFKRGVLYWLSLGLGALFGETIILLLPPAFGIYIYIYHNNGTKFNTNVIFSPYLVSLFILTGFFLYLAVDMIARHKFIHSHTKATHVPGINNSPSSSVRVEELAKRQPVAGNPNIITGPTLVGNTQNIGGGYAGPGIVGAQSTYVPVSQNLESGRLSTEPRMDGEVMRRKTGPWEYSGTKKQSSLIILRQFMYNFYLGVAYGAFFGTLSNYIAISLSIASFFPFVILQTLDAVMLYYAGFERKRIIKWMIFWNLFGMAIFAGSKGIASAGNQATAFMFAIAVGGFLYFITMLMMPALMKERDGSLKWRYFLLFLFGAIMNFVWRAIQ